MDITNHISKNGINTLLIKDPSAKTSSIQFWFRAGSALEDKQDQGIAHFLEHMFFKGSQKRPGNKIAKEVESFGGEINAFTSFDFTCYYINCPGAKTKQSVDILCDMVCNPIFLEADIPAEREVVFEEFKRSIDSSNQYNFSEIQKNFFSSGYNHQILGTEKNIKSFTKKQLLNFRKSYYNKQNSMIIVAGPAKEVEQTKNIIDLYELPEGEISNFHELNVSKNNYSEHRKQTAMGTLTLVAQASDFESTNATYEDFIMGVLGYGETSRLYSSLVIDQNIANGANCSSMFMTKGGAHFIKISFEMNNLSKIIKCVLKELNQLIKTGVSEFEVSRLKKQYLSSKIYDLETTEAFAFSKGHGFAQNGDIDSEDKFIEKFQRISTTEINDNLMKYFPKNWNVNLQIPKNFKSKSSTKSSKQELEKFQKDLNDLINKKQKKTLKTKTFSKFDPSLSYHQIKPGIHLIHKLNAKVKTFAFHSYLKGGLTDETEFNNGSYHFISSLLNSSTNNLSKIEIKNFFEQRAASYSAFSGKNAYGTTLNGLSEDFDDIFPQYAECLVNSKFENKELNKEKVISKRILKAEKEDPTRNCFKKLSATIFSDHPYGLAPIGTLNSISNISVEQLKKIHHQNLKKSPIVFCYSGPSNADTVKKAIFHHLPSLKARKDERKLRLKNITMKKASNHFIHFDREQTQIFIGHQTKAMSNSENLAIKILHTILSGQSSKLFTEVRDEKGLCYSVQPVYFNAMEGGYFGIYMASSNDKVKEAISTINSILKNISTHGISKKEFNESKEMVLGQFEMNLQTNDDFIGIYGVPFLHGNNIDFYYQQNELIKGLKLEDVNKIIKNILKRPTHTILAGKKI